MNLDFNASFGCQEDISVNAESFNFFYCYHMDTYFCTHITWFKLPAVAFGGDSK